jgi:putative N6-adenine-specific DNA methylase/tRNA (guanine6-N2)-methyltransferase
MRFLLTTDPGIEDLAAQEAAERLPSASARVAPYGVAGRVVVEDGLLDPLAGMSTIHHIIEVRAEAQAKSLDDVRRIASGIEFPELPDASSFRISSELTGAHLFSRRELEGAVGRAVQQRYGTRVDLESFEVQIRFDLYGTRVVAGVQRTTRSLGKRIRRARALRNSIKPTLAAAMIRLAGAHRGEGSLVDPLCGIGTIAIEAKRINPELVVRASDWDPPTAEAARQTVNNHGLEIEVRTGDARALGGLFPGAFDYVVSNPPFGVRLARRASSGALYAALLRSFEGALADAGRVVLIAVKSETFRSAVDRTALRIVHERTIVSGGLRPRIYVLDRA